MKQDKTCAIVIPIYEDNLSIISKTSLESLLKNSSDYTKNNYPIILIGPKKLEKQIDEISNYLNKDFYVSSHLFDNKYFESTATYSKLLKSYDFYKVFYKFNYILIYQTDCMMLQDDLKTWIDKDYDYVGAPILVNSAGWKIAPVVGNGGCSLRKVSWFLTVTSPDGDFLRRYKEKLDKEISSRGEEGYKDFEDLYFAELIAYYHGMNKPDYKEALGFAFDMNPDIAFHMSKNLPIFLHAFDKNLRWYNKISKIKNSIDNYDELYIYCEDKYKDLHKYYMKNEENPTTVG